jgi:fatty-acid peroxygenase
MASIPRDRGLDSSLALLRERYEFIGNRSRRYRSDLFETRLMLRKTVCISGPEAARIFYEPDRFTRRQAMPPTALRLLQDFGSVAMLDGAAHRHRKSALMSLMGEPSLARLERLANDQWASYLGRWQRMDRVVLLDEVRELLCRAVCTWAGVRMEESEVGRRTAELAAMIDGAGSVGWRNLRGQRLRNRAERWLGAQVAMIRSGAVTLPEGSPAHSLARHRELDGRLLPESSVVVELLNLIRPTVAVAQYVAFAALALHHYPGCRERLGEDDGDYLEAFVQEVRRFYPFFPFVGGRVVEEFEWRGYRFPAGLRVMLDLFGTNRDSRSWEQPDEFRPERFLGREPGAYDLIPQGGGDHYLGHRCAGEWATVRLLEAAVRFLVASMRYAVPKQDLRVSLRRMPAAPRSRFVISDVRHIPG